MLQILQRKIHNVSPASLLFLLINELSLLCGFTHRALFFILPFKHKIYLIQESDGILDYGKVLKLKNGKSYLLI